MSSSFKYTFTKLRSLPWSLYRCAFSPLWRRVRSASSSPIVAPSASTASFLSVYGRSGVGIRIFVAIELALIEAGSIFLQEPNGHVAGAPAGNRDDDICERRPRVIEVELRRPRRMIRMRMIKAQQLAAELACACFREAIVGRPHQKPAPRSFLGRVRHRLRMRHHAAAADQRAAAFVR